ncbi:MAG: hypothetical protein FWG10_11495 [Eubacteriaceae bacterium]|nr:hypothetical protein [Eubacteriaceae bacterium]
MIDETMRIIELFAENQRVARKEFKWNNAIEAASAALEYALEAKPLILRLSAAASQSLNKKPARCHHSKGQFPYA